MFIDKDNQELLLKLTSIITCTYPNTTPKQATCFFFRKDNGKIIIVTNKHVFENATTAKLYLTAKDGVTNIIKNYDVNITLNSNEVNLHPDYDVSTLDFTTRYDSLVAQNILPQITMLNEAGIFVNYDELDFIQEILMVGYPDGIIDLVTNNPVVRTGVTATPIRHKYNNQEIFLMDIPSFWGSSGSPILIATEAGKIRLVGINFETELNERPVYDKTYKDSTKNIIGYVRIPNDIGRAVNSKIIKEMLDQY